MDTPSLRELQGDFWLAIAADPGTLRAGTPLLTSSAASHTLDAESRLQIYADAYFLRLREVLAEDFPRLAAMLGDDRFTALARDYLRRHPSMHPSVRHVGAALPDFVAAAGDLSAWAGDLARLERARTDVFDAPDDTPIGLDDLRTIDATVWPQLRFTPIRALALLRLAWPAHTVWKDVDAASPAPGVATVRVWRGADYRVFHAPLERHAALALERLIAGEPFAGICAAFDDLPEADGARRAVALLARWLEDGIIAGVRTV
jgi:hypothetical protein